MSAATKPGCSAPAAASYVEAAPAAPCDASGVVGRQRGRQQPVTVGIAHLPTHLSEPLDLNVLGKVSRRELGEVVDLYLALGSSGVDGVNAAEAGAQDLEVQLAAAAKVGGLVARDHGSFTLLCPGLCLVERCGWVIFGPDLSACQCVCVW